MPVSNSYFNFYHSYQHIDWQHEQLTVYSLRPPGDRPLRAEQITPGRRPLTM